MRGKRASGADRDPRDVKHVTAKPNVVADVKVERRS